jgi:NADPH2:quinone reductase
MGLWRSGDAMSLVNSRRLAFQISATYPLADAARAHRELESRATTGKLLLKIR